MCRVRASKIQRKSRVRGITLGFGERGMECDGLRNKASLKSSLLKIPYLYNFEVQVWLFFYLIFLYFAAMMDVKYK